MNELKQLAIDVINDSKGLIASMDEFKEWNSMEDLVRNITALHQFVTKIADIMDEHDAFEKLDPCEFKSIIVDCLDDLIKLPFCLEWADDLVIQAVVNLACDRL